MTDEPFLKPVIWVGSSRKDLRAFPEPVQDQMGYALYVAHAAASIATRKR
jgi:phage-related protein